MAKRDRRKSRRRLRSTLLVPLVVGLLYWWWRRRTESQPASDDGQPPDSIRLEPAALESVAEEADDLTRVGGIGPKVSQLLLSNGIATFAQLATAGTGELSRLLRDAGLPMIDPTTWPDQAGLASEGKWDELSSLQEQLRGR